MKRTVAQVLTVIGALTVAYHVAGFCAGFWTGVKSSVEKYKARIAAGDELAKRREKQANG